jgi:hypothetical protein
MNMEYIIGVLLGNGLVVVAAALLFRKARPVLGDCDTVAERLRHEIPHFRAGAQAHSSNGNAALVEDVGSGALLFVKGIGKGLAVRRLSDGTLKDVKRQGARLSLRLADFTLSRADILLPNEDQAREWETRLRS